jgi:hypothetical protein
MASDKGVLILSDPDNHPPAFDNRDACLAAGTIDDDREAFHLSLVIHASAVALWDMTVIPTHFCSV